MKCNIVIYWQKKKKALLDSSVADYSIIDVAVAVSKSGGGGGGWWVLAESHEGVGEQHGFPAGGLREPPRQREPHRPPVLQRHLVPPANKKKSTIKAQRISLIN